MNINFLRPCLKNIQQLFIICEFVKYTSYYNVTKKNQRSFVGRFHQCAYPCKASNTIYCAYLLKKTSPRKKLVLVAVAVALKRVQVHCPALALPVAFFLRS